VSYQSDISVSKRASLTEFFITIVLAFAFFVYLSITIYTKDPLWVWPVYNSQPVSALIRCYGGEVGLVYNSQPVSALIRCYGGEVRLEGHSTNLAAIAGMVNEQLSGKKRWDELNLTDQTYEEYQSSPRMMILELFYDSPQRVHSSSPFFSNFDSLLIPLDGRHSDTSIIFALIGGMPGGGSFHVQDFQPVVDYLVQRNICSKP